MNLKQIFHFVYGEIDKDFIEKDNNYCFYGFFNLWWLDMILTMAGFISIRDKIDFLEKLNKNNKLLQFYEMINFKVVARIPAVSTFSEYKKALDLSYDWNKENHRMFLTEKAQELASLFSKEKGKEKLGVGLAIDGKDIRNSKNNTKLNAKTIQGVSCGMLLFADLARHEGSWIKTEMKESLLKLQQRFPGVQFCITADAIYNNQNTRKIFYELDVDFLLPLNIASKTTFKRNIVNKLRLAITQKTAFSKIFVRFQKQEKVVDKVILAPVLNRGVTAVLKIERTISSTAPNKIKIEKEELLFIVSTKQKVSKDLLVSLYKMKLSHWQVETYHQKKDMFLNEDRFHKSIRNAMIKSQMNDFILHLLKKLYGGTTKNIFRNLRFDFIQQVLDGIFQKFYLLKNHCFPKWYLMFGLLK